ncbi:hypothetical protein OH76DRAFT_1246619 [Lentinus brumalis]|uniref:Uncharacterized protein n=1 Tax=Lentinus brumalis TaxID=2498619 RepID=A0A371CRY2_9APHY|nr:hypothetical protein OH76DRAFT_1246619 [Polyporus brumalis]
MMNKSLLALYAYKSGDLVHAREHEKCCGGWETNKLGFKWSNRHHPRDKMLFDALVTIISLQLGRLPVAVAQRSDVKCYLSLLAKTSSTAGSVGHTSEADLLIHAYRMCHDEVHKIMDARVALLSDALPLLEDATHDYRARTDEDMRRTFNVLTQACNAIRSLTQYRAAADANALVPQLHKDLTTFIPALYNKDHIALLDRVAQRVITGALVEVCLLSRALEDTIEVAMVDRGFRALLHKGIHCDWIDPAPPVAVAITLNEPSLEELRSSSPALDGVSSDDIVRRLNEKLKAGTRFRTNRGITDLGKVPPTFKFQVSTHCEAALIAHFANRNIESTLYIASAPPACYSCYLLAEAMREVEGGIRFQLEPYSGVIDCGWRLPSELSHMVNVGKTMLSKSDAHLKAAVDATRKVKVPYDDEDW